MKKMLVATLICASCVSTAISQESRKVVNAEPQLSDIYNVLNIMNINIFRFDLNSFLNKKYTMSVYVDEYENNRKTKRVHTKNVGHNIKSLADIPEEMRDDFRKLKQVPEGKNEWDNIKELSVYVRKTNDSTAVFTIDIPGAMRMGLPAKLRPIGEFKTYFYQTRPFTFKQVGEEKNLEIPLILYGSGWQDPKYNVIRFCGENEIDPDMKSEILTDLPHHYIIGIELKEVQ